MKHCSRCGTPNEDGNHFCVTCGEPLSESESSPEDEDTSPHGPSRPRTSEESPASPSETPSPFPQPQPPHRQPPARTSSPVRRGLVIAVLCLAVVALIAVALVVVLALRPDADATDPTGTSSPGTEETPLPDTKFARAITALGAPLSSYAPAVDDLSFYDDESGCGFVNNTVLVFFSKDATASQIQGVADALDGAEIVGTIPSCSQAQFRVAARSENDLSALCDSLTSCDGVLSAIVDCAAPTVLDDLSTPNDPWIGPTASDAASRDYQEALEASLGLEESPVWDENDPAGANWYLEATHVLSAWQYADQMTPINIGVVDGYLYPNHEDVQMTILNEEENESLRGRCEERGDRLGHGIMNAGIIAATSNNGIGVSGVVPQSVVGSLNGISYDTNAGSPFDPLEWLSNWIADPLNPDNRPKTTSELMECIGSCLDAQSKVVNLSMGKTFEANENPSRNVADAKNAVKYLYGWIDTYGPDFLIVQAAGNGQPDDTGTYRGIDASLNGYFASIMPEDIDAVLAAPNYSSAGITAKDIDGSFMIVGAVDCEKTNDDIWQQWWQLAEFSNYGANVDICAPGRGIYNAYYYETDDDQEALYYYSAGTSQAAPIITGIAALTWATNPDLSAPQVKEILIKTATAQVLPRADDDAGTYYWMADARAAVELALELAEDPDSGVDFACPYFTVEVPKGWHRWESGDDSYAPKEVPAWDVENGKTAASGWAPSSADLPEGVVAAYTFNYGGVGDEYSGEGGGAVVMVTQPGADVFGTRQIGTTSDGLSVILNEAAASFFSYPDATQLTDTGARITLK